MDISALAQDAAAFAAWRREAFPYFARKTCLTHASVSPLPLTSAQAVAEYAARIAHEGQFDFVHDATYRRCKQRVAELLGHGATASEVAFAGSTSHALGIVATGIGWRPGDNCVVADGDFPANVVTWKNLTATHGVELRTVPYRPVMDITVADLEPLIDSRTRIVSLASANFLSGYPLDLAAIGEWLHAHGVLFCIDGIQTLGAVPMDVSHVDFVCADSHKWLLGPNGIAVLWARQSALEQLRPAILGWLATAGRDNWYDYDITPIATGERFEPGARNYLGIVAFEASLALLQEAGAEFVAARVTHLRDYAARLLSEVGCRLLWHPEPARQAGIVSFQPGQGDTRALYHVIDKEFAVSIRRDKAGADWIRLSPHFVNTENDLERLVTVVSQFGV